MKNSFLAVQRCTERRPARGYAESWLRRGEITDHPDMTDPFLNQKEEGKVVSDLTKIYPRVTLKPKSEWDAEWKPILKAAEQGATKRIGTITLNY